ncbi:MAG: hypothetical protein GTO45_30480 [Candidatus Aminicenantes bacterium]|nr:hypothetical protein [Candidatus Aminicenantes bacterium]NIM83120.1 hypothetical protein [Candidatus Aminicenantes bacterium]NIN22499.1 hypothetical protein [Candidatus Aminicenantes bacterium]NIN46267.1 hypothetical protein [Candidatus Aminicenantes bacterium]NIN89105.1 hypothetical protein [Candidatus Aminicenantes bacterium]
MQTLHVKTNEKVMTKILDFINTLSRQGDEIEVLDDKIYAYEKQQIDQSLQDIKEGKVYDIEEVERELLNAS